MLRQLVDVVRGAMVGARVAWATRSHATSDLKNPATWLLEAFGVRRTASGVDVTPKTALEAVPFFAAVRNICEDLGSLPFLLYERTGNRSRQRAVDHPLYSVLHDVPNPEMDSLQFVETMQAHATLRPCAYAEVVRSEVDGSIEEIWPLHPDRVHPFRRDGERIYRIDLPEGERGPNGEPWVHLFDDQVFRLRSISLDGWDGLSLVRLGRESLGLTIALELYGAEFFGNDATPGGFFEHPGEMGEEAQARFLRSIEKEHRGLGKKHRFRILEEGMKFSKSALQNDHAQFLESRRYQVEEAARLARIPLHMIGAMDRATFSNIEHQGIDYVVHTIRPRAVRWERAITLQLLTPKERRTYYARFLLDALMRGDLKSRFDAYAVGRQWGFLSANDICELEERNPLPAGGDIYLEPENMRPAGKWAPRAGGPDQNRVARAFDGLFAAAFDRCLRKESSAMERAAKRTLAEFEPWARTFFDGHQADVREALEPVVDGLVRLTHAEHEDMADYAALLAQRYTRSALEDLGEHVRGNTDQPEAAIRRWAEGRRAEAAAVGRRECERALRLFALGNRAA